MDKCKEDQITLEKVNLEFSTCKDKSAEKDS